MILTFCIGRETIEALEVGIPVQIGQGAVAIPADSYDYPYKRIADLESALAAVVRDVNDYESTNNLHPNPGRAECWDSVARAKALLASKS